MLELNKVKIALKQGVAQVLFEQLYGKKSGVVEKQIQRYVSAIDQFSEIYPEHSEIDLFSTPGRTEVGGNHTDHNAGRVLAAAIDLDVIAVAAKNNTGIISIHSEGFSRNEIQISQLAAVRDERYTSAALIRGVCARLNELGYAIGGFDAYITSNVLKGSGLSSSAAFEVIVVSILNHFYNEAKIDDILGAQIAQVAENEYFGKPCGLMDQTTCAVGGLVTIDFEDFDSPIVRKVDYDFSNNGFTMVIVDTGGNHADLNEDYEALEHEMKEVAKALGGQVLREIPKDRMLGNINVLRTKVSDRAILRALHFYADDQRVVKQVDALEKNNYFKFLELVIESGNSSWMLCQNCYSTQDVEKQGITVALAMTEHFLKGKGAWRVHGGGFAGTIQSFVPNEVLEDYLRLMQAVFGGDSCHELIIRPYGTMRIALEV